MKALRKKFLLIFVLIALFFAVVLVAYNVCSNKAATAATTAIQSMNVGSKHIESVTGFSGADAEVTLSGTGKMSGGNYYFNTSALNLTVYVGEKANMGFALNTWVLCYYKLYSYNGNSWSGASQQNRLATFGAKAYTWQNSGYQFWRIGTASSPVLKTIQQHVYEKLDSSEIEDTRKFTELVTDTTDNVGNTSFDIVDGTYKIKIWIFTCYETGINQEKTTGRLYSFESPSFYVDNTSPTLSLSCGDNGYANSSVSVTYSDKSPVSGYYGIGTGSTFPTTSTSNTMTSGKSFTSEGNYAVSAVDVVGNSTTKYFTIDKTAPTLTLSGVSDGGITNSSVRVSWDTTSIGAGKQRSNSNDTLTVLFGYSSTSTYPSTATSTCTDSQLFSSEGSYIVKISDKAGNSTTYRFQIDKSAPTVSAPNEYVNTSFVFSATDKFSGVKIEYRKDGITTTTVDAASFSVSRTENNYGAWQFRAYDVAGNYTSWYSVNFYYRATFGNKNEIYNSFYIPAYYVVTLPARVYTDIYGKYTFSSYSSALDWATSKEWEYRVVSLSGDRWTYVNIANESVIQVYTDRAELDAAVNKYAASYISDRALMSSSGGSLSNPVDINGIERDDALTAQLNSLPSHLSKYSDLPYMFIQQTYTFLKPVAGVAGNSPTLTVQYISNGITQESDTAIQIDYGVTLKSALTALGKWKQGYYLVTESDTCGNFEQYILCVDSGEASMIAQVTQGDGTFSELCFDRAYVEQYSDILRYISFTVVDLFDSLDDFVLLNISGRGIDSLTYLIGDDIPELCFDNGYYGVYSITIYDRSLNVVQFNIQIAGAQPSMSYTSLTNETKCTLTVNVNDSNNAITSLKLYKVTYTGELVLQIADSDGTLITNENLSYVLRVGGKYVMEFTDVFGRKIITDPIFYMKGLPVGTLSGVKDGGLTNSDVALSYDPSCSVILYLWQDGAWIMADGLMQITDGLSSCSASISASTVTSYNFKYFLYVTEDMNLFTEYTFEIDCIPPEVNVFDVNGGAVVPDTVTSESFYLTWLESGYTAYYYNKNSILGSLSQVKYTKGTKLTQAGTYVFEVYDTAKNVTSFEITLDNVVSWTLESTSYSMLEDGSYISKYYFTLTVTERTSVWQVTSSNGLNPVNGQRIDIDGKYSYHIEDVYGNVLELVLVVDNLPPTALITAEDGTSLSSGGKTNKSFTVVCEEDNVIITYAVGNSSYVAYDGSLINEVGTYSFKLSDRMGNSQTVTVTIDRDVSYSISGSFLEKDGIYYSRNYITVTVTEEYKSFIICDSFGVQLDVSARLNTEGSYTVSITDNADNDTMFTVVIDKTPPTAKIQSLSGDEVDYGSTLIGSFLVYCEEEGSTITYARGSSSYSSYDGSYLSTSGTYYFTVADFLGNTDTFTVKIDLAVDFMLGGTYVEDDDGTYYAKNWLTITMNEGYSRLFIESESGRSYSEGDRITEEGVYNVFIEDSYGNTVQFYIVIDRTAPNISLDGVEVGGKTNGDVLITIEDCMSASYTLGGMKYDFETWQTVTDEGGYTVTAIDFVGNTASVTFTIDKSVDVTPSRELLSGQIITGTVSFTFGEKVTAVLDVNGSQTNYQRGNLADVGTYKLKVSDELGNVAEYEWTILSSIARCFNFDLLNDVDVTILLNGNVVTSAVSDGKVMLTESGEYILTFIDIDGESYELRLAVDTIAPTVQITQGKRQVTISEPSKDGLTYSLYKNGVQMTYKMGDRITDIGNYKLIVSDSLGNSTEYSFNLNYINTAGVLLIVFVCLLIAAVVTIVIVVRLKQRIR